MPEPRTYFFESCLGVFQGGGCRGAAFVGALRHVAERGVNFSGVAGTSAGSIIAALLAAGATADQIGALLAQIDFKDFLRPPEPIKSKISTWQRIGGAIGDWFYPGISEVIQKHGRYSSVKIEEWLNGALKQLLPKTDGKNVKFKDLIKPLWVVAADIVAQDVKVWSHGQSPDEDVAHAVRCSCSIPGFFQPVDNHYVDGGILSNLPSFTFSSEASAIHSKRILAFTLRLDTPEDYFKAVLNTALDGSVNIQARLVENVYEIRIQTGSISATDFADMDDKKTAQLIRNGTDAAKEFFDGELGKVRPSSARRTVCEGTDEVLTELTTILNVRNIKKLFVADEDSNWLYSIFPAFLKWRTQGVEIHAFLPPEDRKPHELYRRRLMAEMGIVFHSTAQVPFRGFLIDPQNSTDCAALVYMEDTVGNEVRAIKYVGPDDFPAIRALHAMLGPVGTYSEAGPPKLQRGSDLDLEKKLRDHVSQYGQASISMRMETVNVSDLMALSSLVREYKYQQIKSLHGMFRTAGLDPFDVAVVKYPGGKETIVTPPIVEASGKSFYLIQGTTRAFFCVREGIEQIRCLVVRNLSAALPSANHTPIREVLVGGRTLNTLERYGQPIDADFRHIEFAVHLPSETLL